MAGKYGRREFLLDSGALLAAGFFPSWAWDRELLPSVELAPVLARGYLTDIGGKLYGNPMEILSGDKYFQYLIREGKRTRRVLMKTIQVTEGYPFPDVVTSERIGMRLDSPELMEHVAPSGARSVRIYGYIENVGVGGSVLESALSAAETQGLSPLLVFAPTWPREDDYIRDKVSSVLVNHPTVVFNLGNEPDNRDVEFWKDQDLVTFAHFAMTALGMIWEQSWQRGGQTLAVVAGLQDINNTTKYLQVLKDAGLNFNNPFLRLGLHSYQGVADFSRRWGVVKGAHRRLGIKMPKYWLTEVGVTYPGWSKWIALEMVMEGFRQGVERAFVHTLVDNSEGFELMSNDGSVRLPTYYGFQSLARRL